MMGNNSFLNSFLDEIIAYKRQEVAAAKAAKPLGELVRAIDQLPQCRPFKEALRESGIRLIAELKKASPSKGLLRADFKPGILAASYEAAGAAAISVLTDSRFFQGSLSILRSAKESTLTLPVLRKDFIIDPYQLFEARCYGADAVLLVTAALTPDRLAGMIIQTRELGMASLVEVHNREELGIALESGAEIIGINNRDLRSFTVFPETVFELLPDIPPQVTVVAESGIHHRSQIIRLKEAGIRAVLVGEALVTAADPKAVIREFLGGRDS